MPFTPYIIEDDELMGFKSMPSFIDSLTELSESIMTAPNKEVALKEGL